MPLTAAGYYYADGSTPMSAEDISAAEATAAQGVYDGLVEDSYLFRQTVYFTSSGTFSKATYPWLRAIRVKCVGGGGGGGGTGSISGSSYAAGGGGGGGSYGESFITDIAGLASSVTVTVGGRGSVSSGGVGGNGGDSSFGALTAPGGGGGQADAGGSGNGVTNGGAPGNSTDFDINHRGGRGELGLRVAGATVRWGGFGGGSHIAPPTPIASYSSGDGTNATGTNYGAGGSGAHATPTSSAFSGGLGGLGIVIVELFG